MIQSQELNFGGGILGGLRYLLDFKNKISEFGIDVGQAADLMPAMDALSIAETADGKLTAFQLLLREFFEFTTKTELDDQASAILDGMLKPGPVRDFVVKMLDKALSPTESDPSQPGFVLESNQVPDEVVQEFKIFNREIDPAQVAKVVGFLVQLVAMFGK